MPGAKKFTLLGLMVGASAKKFAQKAQNTPNSSFLYSLGEFFRGSAGGGAVPGEFCRSDRYCARSCRRRAPSIPAGALHEAVAPRVAGLSDPHVVQFPRTGITKPPGARPGGGGAGDGNRTRL